MKYLLPQLTLEFRVNQANSTFYFILFQRSTFCGEWKFNHFIQFNILTFKCNKSWTLLTKTISTFHETQSRVNKMIQLTRWLSQTKLHFQPSHSQDCFMNFNAQNADFTKGSAFVFLGRIMKRHLMRFGLRGWIGIRASKSPQTTRRSPQIAL